MRLGILGAWHTHAEGIVHQIAARPDEFTLIGCYDADPLVRQRREAWRQTIPDLQVFDNAEQLLSQPLDGIVVEGRVSENLALARSAIEAGLPVLLEKPAGVNLDDFRSLAERASEKGLHLQMAYLFRYMSAVMELVRRAKSGELGRIYEFRARLPKDVALYEDYVRDYAHYPGGIFFEMAGHLVDMMVTVLGTPKSVTPFLGRHAAAPREFVDNGMAVFEYEHAWGILEVPALEAANDCRRIEVFGTQGACVIPHLGSGHLSNAPTQPIDVFHADTLWERLDLPAATLQISDLRELAACAAGDKTADYSIDHDLVVQQTLLKACDAI